MNQLWVIDDVSVQIQLTQRDLTHVLPMNHEESMVEIIDMYLHGFS